MKERIKTNQCFIKKESKFLFWKFDTSYYSHTWAYTEDLLREIDGEEKPYIRHCIKCGRREILFGTYRDDGEKYEDWRLTT